ncbi:MAG: radical SAM protein [Candidatus Omnitrophica bacterium]|nr:radical SAM protein [Candidatus Omnitrophota bacterium]
MYLKNIFNTHIFELFKKTIYAYPHFRIALTYRCNNACPYCSYRETNTDPRHDMTLDDFVRILQWLKRQKIRKILLTGGEPFIHKRIGDILKLCDKEKFAVSVLTNGLLINEEIKSFIKTQKKIFLILNINLDESYQLVEKNMIGIEHRVCMVRYNFNKNSMDSSLLFQFAKKICVPIRFGFTVPSLYGNNEYYSFDDMVIHKQEICEFIHCAKTYGVKVHFARPLPRCLFSKQEWSYVKSKGGAKSMCLVGQYGNYASRAIVKADLSVDCCYGAFLKAKYLFDFSDLKALSDYFQSDFENIKKKPLMEECTKCAFFKRFSCQGGCLVYKVC